MCQTSRLQAKFEFHHGDYEKQCLHALGRKDKAGMVMNNPTQSVFLFMNRQHLQVSQHIDNITTCRFDCIFSCCSLISSNMRSEGFNLRQQRSLMCFDCLSCRLLKQRLQFSSCAASACTCPRTSWPAGVWETWRITSAHTCLIKASSST